MNNSQNKAKSTIRPAAVAGQFYPANPAELKLMVESYLNDVQDAPPPSKAIIAQHAGLIYSGPIAAIAYASLQSVKEEISRVVLLGPSHRVYLKGLALSSADYYETPLGKIEIDQDSYDSIRNLSQVAVVDAAHAQEHSLEVHLPFLQLVLDQFKLIPIVVGEASPEEVEEVLEILWGNDDTLVVISSDLSHYHDYETAQQLDLSTSKAIENLQLESIGPQQACGCMPMRGLLQLARNKHLKVKTLDLRNSGDTAGGKDRVVGYGAYAVN
ncbi:MAG: AmmeMemoRadiSam system protein B [Proteobacteria bacterium]|nr:AmmeMemoRadiSam system protein B [Pseudomonadota bacterium]